MSYRDALTELGADSERQALAVLASWREGLIEGSEFVALLAAFVAAANGKAVALADLSLAAAVTLAVGRPVPPLGLLPPPDDADRLHKAASTVLALSRDADDPTMRVSRLARAEPYEAAARAYSEGMARSEHVTGWTRGLNGEACQLCEWWSRDGRVWPDTHPMPTHKGCTCSPIPTTR